MLELKPCPFCGSDVISRVKIINKETLEFSVICKKCDAKRVEQFELFDTNFYNISVVIRENINAWNRRTKDAKTD